jgi:hypothetical protein
MDLLYWHHPKSSYEEQCLPWGWITIQATSRCKVYPKFWKETTSFVVSKLIRQIWYGFDMQNMKDTCTKDLTNFDSYIYIKNLNNYIITSYIILWVSLSAYGHLCRRTQWTHSCYGGLQGYLHLRNLCRTCVRSSASFSLCKVHLP